MSNATKETSNAVKMCAGCPVCQYTRSCKKITLRYYINRLLEKICPNCRKVNKELHKDFQKSKHF